MDESQPPVSDYHLSILRESMIPIHPTLYGCTLQGTVALMSRANQKTLSFASKPKPLSARWVLDQFRAITITKGDKAQGRKVDVVKSMMVKCQGSEAK